MTESEINIKIQFGGGMELLFKDAKANQAYNVSLPASAPPSRTKPTRPADVTFLIQWLKENRLKEREDLFVKEETLRPGILVLINDEDWELQGEDDYQLKQDDEVVFISTLHGG